MTDDRGARRPLLPLAGIIVGAFVVAGAALAIVGGVRIARGGPVDGFAALGIAGLLLVGFGVRLRALSGDDAEGAGSGAPTPWWRPAPSALVGYAAVFFAAYFVLRVWRHYPWEFAAAFVVVALAATVFRRWLVRRSRRGGSAV